MTCEQWPWWVLSHTKGQRHHLQKEKDPRMLTKSFTSFPINYWHAVVSWKASQTFRWSVWWIFQLTNRLPDTLHQINVWLERGRSSWPQSCTYACTCIYCYTVVVVTILFLMFYLLFIYIDFSLDWVCVTFLFWLQPTKIHDLKKKLRTKTNLKLYIQRWKVFKYHLKCFMLCCTSTPTSTFQR